MARRQRRQLRRSYREAIASVRAAVAALQAQLSDEVRSALSSTITAYDAYLAQEDPLLVESPPTIPDEVASLLRAFLRREQQ